MTEALSSKGSYLILLVLNEGKIVGTWARIDFSPLSRMQVTEGFLWAGSCFLFFVFNYSMLYCFLLGRKF